MIESFPLISVVIPVYNGERFLAAALDSVFAQDYRLIETIVVDDGSTDRTAEIAHHYPDVHYIYQSNQGPGSARNTGINVARGEFVAFLDADDIWLSDKLITQMEYFLLHPQVGYVISRMHFILEPGVKWPSQLNQEHCLQDPPGFLPSSLLVRKVVLDQVGTFDQHSQMNTAEDVDWFARATDLNVSMAVVDRVLLHRRIHDKNISINLAENTQNLFTVLRHSLARKRKAAESSESSLISEQTRGRDHGVYQNEGLP